MLSLRGRRDLQALVASEIVVAALAVFRFYDYWTTGFFVPDEYGYYYNGLHGLTYAGRWFFGDLNGLVFRFFGISNVDAYSYFLPLYIFFWTSVTFVFVYKLLCELESDVTTRTVTILSSFILISFVILSLGFLTEPMGLALAMGGIYCIVKFYRSDGGPSKLLYPLIAASLFGFAGATREPYDAFLVGGVVMVLIGTWRHLRKVGAPTLERAGGRRFVLAICAILLFAGPAAAFYLGNSATSSQLSSLGPQIAQSVISNPSNAVITTTSTSTETVTTTQTVTELNTTVTTSSVVTSIVTLRHTSPSPFYGKSLLLNTLVIFVGGILLGWGPVAFLIGAIGLAALFRRALIGRESRSGLILLAVLVALGSYFVVSYIFASDPNYFSFQNYSTIIRFSDTALPAFFLTAPIALGIIAKKKGRLRWYGAAIVGFLVVAVPVYQSLAASNVAYVGANPFALGYRTEAVLIRDYINQNLSGQDVTILGVPYGWVFTPGIQDLHQTQVYAFSAGPGIANITADGFASLRPPTFYVFENGPASIASGAPWLTPLLNSSVGQGSINGVPYTVVDRAPVINNPSFQLIKINLVWG